MDFIISPTDFFLDKPAGQAYNLLDKLIILICYCFSPAAGFPTEHQRTGKNGKGIGDFSEEGKTGMSLFEKELNDLLVQTYRSIGLMEEQMVCTSKHMNLSINEIHLLEAVGDVGERQDGLTISEISEKMGISLPSVTAAINKLVKKGYVEKNRSQIDGRVVHVTLTKIGQKANTAHRYFHIRMVRSIVQDLTQEEQAAMLKGMRKLNLFFAQKIHRTEEEI